MENRDPQQNKNIPLTFTTGQTQYGGKPTKKGMAIDSALHPVQ
jgi:hypothetical protein